jgi:hypothetical protein
MTQPFTLCRPCHSAVLPKPASSPVYLTSVRTKFLFSRPQSPLHHRSTHDVHYSYNHHFSTNRGCEDHPPGGSPTLRVLPSGRSIHPNHSLVTLPTAPGPSPNQRWMIIISWDWHGNEGTFILINRNGVDVVCLIFPRFKIPTVLAGKWGIDWIILVSLNEPRR